MAFYRTYDRPCFYPACFVGDSFSPMSSANTWTSSSSGPPAHQVPIPGFCWPRTKHSLHASQIRKSENQLSSQRPACRNPMPSTGSRRDACGAWSFGSEGHECGLCAGPCKDLRSGRGCTFGMKCKKCHFPHPEVSSTSLRGKKSKARRAMELMQDFGRAQQMHCSNPEQSETYFHAMSQLLSGQTPVFL
eukprot:TRINITY_DN9864_c0_g1_i4.p1 TRINITY_DN9864_c0_g1~~TRINITY_DN9864_c0_g1_i4.p1  ORF type:complete len:190 (-),score=11.98 TRINITY_DN9864_c0_g1_i4:609-1178(-)